MPCKTVPVPLTETAAARKVPHVAVVVTRQLPFARVQPPLPFLSGRFWAEAAFHENEPAFEFEQALYFS